MQNRFFGQNKYLYSTQRFQIRGSYVLVSLVGVLMVLNCLLVYCILFSGQGIPGLRQQSQQVQEVENKIQRLKEENQRFFRQIQSFKSNTAAQERFVRQQLGWAKEKELVFEFTLPRK